MCLSLQALKSEYRLLFLLEKTTIEKKKISAFLTVILDSTQLLQADLDWSLILSWAIRICPNREHIIPGLIGLQNKLYKLFRFVTGISTNQYPVTFLMTFSCHNSWENRILSTITPWRSINLWNSQHYCLICLFIAIPTCFWRCLIIVLFICLRKYQLISPRNKIEKNPLLVSRYVYNFYIITGCDERGPLRHVRAHINCFIQIG